MRICELKDKPLKVYEVYDNKVLLAPVYLAGVGQLCNPVFVEDKIIHMQVITDGIIQDESEEEIDTISEYYIGGKRYNVNTYKSKKVTFKDYSYVIVFLLANEFSQVEKEAAWFDMVKEVTIYVKDLDDKEAIKKAKNVINKINGYENGVYFNEVNIPETYDAKGNVHTLKRER